jgi:hypothetical protein
MFTININLIGCVGEVAQVWLVFFVLAIKNKMDGSWKKVAQMRMSARRFRGWK